MILKQQEIKNENSGRPRRRFWRFIDGQQHVLVACDWKAKSAVISIQEETEQAMNTVWIADFDLPDDMNEAEAKELAVKALEEWRKR